MRTKTKIKTVLFSIIALIFGVILGMGSYAIAFTPESDLLYRVTKGELSIHFLELGNKYAGDSIYIKANDYDILIDAGSRPDSASKISSYIDNYCTDNSLEYVIATHADQDHIAAFPKIFEKYEVKNVIDFGTATNKTTKTLEKYRDAVNNEENVKYAKASDYNEPDFLSNIDNAIPNDKTISLGEGITLKILYNYYQDHKTETTDENNYSVCLLLTQGSNNILLTGDLEKDGEEKLVQNNDLPECVLFKAGHHGSKTSSTEVLLSKIKPKNVVFTCVAGSSEYTDNLLNMFPTQVAIDNISKYTKNCYVTSLCTNTDGKYDKFTSMNGDIIFKSNKNESKIICNNNYDLLKDTKWFETYRTWNGVA